MLKNDFDIIILGGGLVGLTAAHLCANQDLSVVVIEQGMPDVTWDVEKCAVRCSAISRKSQKIFEKIGVWQSMVAQRISPYRSMVVWDAVGFSEITFDAVEVTEPDLGHMIENRIMAETLWKAAEQHPNITLRPTTHPKTLQVDPHCIRLETHDQVITQATLIIGADGAHSWLRKAAKVEVIQRDYHQWSLIATVKTDLPHQETAWQRFLPEGPLAFLPLLEPFTSSIVWTSTEEKIASLMLLPEKQFCQELAHAFDYRLGQVLSSSERQHFPLQMIHAKQYIQDRMVFIGDALHVIHPLAGQGLNLGLDDAWELAEIVATAKVACLDIGSRLVLRKFERARQGAIRTMMMTVEFLRRIFGSQLSLVVWLRNVGVDLVSRSGILKKKMIQAALGI